MLAELDSSLCGVPQKSRAGCPFLHSLQPSSSKSGTSSRLLWSGVLSASGPRQTAHVSLSDMPPGPEQCLLPAALQRSQPLWQPVWASKRTPVCRWGLFTITWCIELAHRLASTVVASNSKNPFAVQSATVCALIGACTQGCLQGSHGHGGACKRERLGSCRAQCRLP